MKDALFQRFCQLAYAQAGIRLRPGKEALVGARIAKRMRALGIVSHEQYFDFLAANRESELVPFLDVISTNTTSFFRERSHFDVLESFVKNRLATGATRMRFWSAASSSGEEPYSMAIVINELVGGGKPDWRILATDISTAMLDQARQGVYKAAGLKALGATLTKRYFTDAGSDRWGNQLMRVSAELASHVVFKRLNLATPPFPMSGPIEAVFCRNVMIYFDHGVRQPLVTAIENVLAHDGFLAVGHAESLAGIETTLKALRPSVYTKPARLPQKERPLRPWRR